MYTSYYNRNTNKKDELKKLESQTREGNAAYDKGEAMLTGEEKQGKSPTPPLRQDNTSGVGSIIKDSLNYILQKKYPDNRYTGVFDGIDDAEIENNLPLADEVIAKNSANPYNKDLFPNLPNLRGGLATFYTAAFSGNYEAANAARTLAYTEDKNEDKEQQKNSFNVSAQHLKPVEKATDTQQNESYVIPKTAIKPYNNSDDSYFKNLSNDNEYFVFGKENQPVAVTKNGASAKLNNYFYDDLDPKEYILKTLNFNGKAKTIDTNSNSFENSIISPLDAANLAKKLYDVIDDSKINGSKTSDYGEWKFKGLEIDSDGLQIGIFEKEMNGKKYYAIVNSGSSLNFKTIDGVRETNKDFENNIKQPFGKSENMEESIMFARRFVAEHPDAEIVFIGHSKGGAEAAANAVATNKDAIIFNPARANYEAYDLNREAYEGSIISLVVEGEPLDFVLDFISKYFPQYVPNQESETEELEKEQVSKQSFNTIYDELKFYAKAWLDLHGIQTVIDILKRGNGQ